MRIVQVVSLVSEGGSFGGPVSVATQQVEALALRGHEVRLLAGWDGRAAPTTAAVRTEFFRARRLVPVAGFSALAAPAMLAVLRRLAARADVVHVHLARDLVTLPAALLASTSRAGLVVQTHGMVMPDVRKVCRVLDLIATRPVLRAAQAQLVLTEAEEKGAAVLAASRSNVQRLGNALQPTDLRASWRERGEPEVLFCARLHERKRVLSFVGMARILLDRGVRARFTVIGSDEGDLGPLLAEIGQAGLAANMQYGGALSPNLVRARLAQAQVYVLPSVDEPFPMTVLEAASVGLPVVITRSNGLAATVERYGRGLVTSGEPESLANAVKAILASPDRWLNMSQAMQEMSSAEFALDPVINRLEQIYGVN